MTTDEARDAYARRADDYIELFGTIDSTSPIDRELVGRWAAGLDGPVLDVGCGPGQWTAWLHERGVDIAGADPVMRFVDHARASHPGCRFTVGRAENLAVADSQLAGVLAWYSLIHTEPRHLAGVLVEFSRALRPDGSLLLGFFTGDEMAPFGHAVTTAHFWPVSEMSRTLDEAGFTIRETHSRQDPGTRPLAAVIADRRR
ncbi:class I SAM-dependent methyltransferase [Gordonia sp. CPCC 206044]|uniref:class I SAM-dependent methyltransferase n=1 Tax=Gordonia sp. CPCC 206044 TaxID=3140793 RepID=UPI003AF3D6B8